MASYQKEKAKVKQAIQVIDAEILKSKAAQGLLNLSIELGMEVLAQMLEAEVEAIAGPKGTHNPDRMAYRHGTEKSKVVMGGEKLDIQKPRIRAIGGAELPLPVLASFQNEDPLQETTMARMLAGISSRKYAGTLETAGQDGTGASKSAASRRFAAGLEGKMKEFYDRRIEGSYPVIMIDGIGIGEMTVISAMGIDENGHKRMLGLAQGGTENSIVVESMLADMLERGLPKHTSRLFVLDGGKALSKAVRDTFGRYAMIQRCQVHKKRNVLAQLPESVKANTSLLISRAYLEPEYEAAKSLLERLARQLETAYPKAAQSLREGMEETLTVHRLGMPGLLRQTLSNTNPIESANSVCSTLLRRVKRWKDGEMTLRYAGAGFLEAEKGFRRIRGYKQLPLLTAALEKLVNPQEVERTHSA